MNDDEQPPHSADDAPATPAAKAKRQKRTRKPPAPASPDSRAFMLYHGKVGFWDGNGWVEINARAAKSALLETGLGDDEAKDAAMSLPIAAGLGFDPATTERVITEPSGVRWLNTYYGVPALGPEGPYPDIDKLLSHLLGHDDAGVAWVLDWLAAPLQSLHAGKGSKRTLGAVVLHGIEGSGKGLLKQILEVLYGESHVLTIDQNAMEDSFSPEGLERAFMLVSDEVTSETKRSSEHVSAKLKAWVTDPKIQLRGMQKASKSTRIHFNVLFTTNSRRPVRLSEGDRRYSVFWQEQKLPKDVIEAVVADLAAGGPQIRAFGHSLLQRKLTFDLTVPYENESRATLKVESVDAQTAFARYLVEVGIEVASEKWCLDRRAKMKAADGDVHTVEDVQPWVQTVNGIFVPNPHMNEIFQSFCQSHGLRANADLAPALKAVGITGNHPAKFKGKSWRGYIGVPSIPGDPEPVKEKPLPLPDVGGWPRDRH